MLRASQSNRAAAPGQRLTLVLDFEMLPNMHVYAPGVKGYRALDLRLDPHPLVTLHEGSFRVTRDVSLAGGRELADALKAPAPRLEIRGTLEYQAGSDVVCYPPARVPLSFTLDLLPLDRERSPKASPPAPLP